MAKNFSIALVGGGGVGKSSIVTQFVNHTFSDMWDPTVEEEYFKDFHINDEIIKLTVYDTAGQEEYRNLTLQTVSKCDGVILVFSFDNAQSLKDFRNLHADIIKANPHCPIIVVGNKMDHEPWQVEFEEAKRTVEGLKIESIPPHLAKYIREDEDEDEEKYSEEDNDQENTERKNSQSIPPILKASAKERIGVDPIFNLILHAILDFKKNQATQSQNKKKKQGKCIIS